MTKKSRIELIKDDLHDDNSHRYITPYGQMVCIDLTKVYDDIDFLIKKIELLQDLIN